MNSYRQLIEAEITELKTNNSAEQWTSVYVKDPFSPENIRQSRLFGTVYLGPFTRPQRRHRGMVFAVGLYNSTVSDCTIGRDAVVDSVRHLSHYKVGDEVILSDIGEISAFQLPDELLVGVGNENGARELALSPGMTIGDCFLWAKYRGNRAFLEQCSAMSRTLREDQMPAFGTIEANSIIEHVGSIRNTYIGPYTAIDNAVSIRNCYINSSESHRTGIEDGAVVVDGIVGFANSITRGASVSRFLTGTNVRLTNGVDVTDAVIGSNATISGAEVLSSLMFPFHEQHHKTSFLCATTIAGQSNIAAGAVIGSNHNSRRNDGELIAARGFWPGLCTSFKHNSRFASFSLVVKGSYKSELNVMLPFSLISESGNSGSIIILPAYWFLYNMYALERNRIKYRQRDRRRQIEQDRYRLEYDYLAPDTIDEMLRARHLLECWTATAWSTSQGTGGEPYHESEHARKGRDLLTRHKEKVESLTVLGEGIVPDTLEAKVLKVVPAYTIYGDMVHLYAAETLVEVLYSEKKSLQEWVQEAGIVSTDRLHIGNSPVPSWTNVGGQLMLTTEVEKIVEDIASGRLDTWDKVHREAGRQSEQYGKTRAIHAFEVFLSLTEGAPETVDQQTWRRFLLEAVEIKEECFSRVKRSREKDYRSPFRSLTFDSKEEEQAVYGVLEDDELFGQLEAELEAFRGKAATV